MNQAKKVHSHPESFQETRSCLITINKETHLSPTHWMSPFVSPKGSSYILSLLLQKVQVPQNPALTGRGEVPTQTYAHFQEEQALGWQDTEKGERQAGRCKSVSTRFTLQWGLFVYATYITCPTQIIRKEKREDGARFRMLWDRSGESIRMWTNTHWPSFSMLGATQRVSIIKSLTFRM